MWYKACTWVLAYKKYVNNNNNKSFIFPQISVTMTGIEFLRSDFTGYSVHEHVFEVENLSILTL